MFGAPGMSGQIGYAYPNYELGYGFLSRYNSPTGFQNHDPRFQRLQEIVLRVVQNTESGWGRQILKVWVNPIKKIMFMASTNALITILYDTAVSLVSLRKPS